MEIVLIVPVLIIIVILIRLVAGSMDGDRVREYIESRGGKLLEKHWNPFGKGWFGSGHERIYEIRYMDGEGNEHLATCKTSMLAWVYMTEDQIVRSARNALPLESLLEENRRLRDELALPKKR